MAVVDSSKPAEKEGETASQNGGPPRSSTPTQEKKKKGGPGAWIKKNKLAAGGIAVGAAVLIMSHKGAKGGESNSKALAEALEAQRAAALGGGVNPSSAPSGPGGGSEGGAASGSGTPGATTPTPANPTGAGEAPASSGDPQLAAAVESLGGNVAALAAAEGEKSPAKAQAAAKKKKPAPKKAAKAKPKKTTHHGGVTVHGRHFPGAKSTHKGPAQRDSHGNVTQTVTINYGGHSTTHTSHNGGQHWTDHTPGHNPPSRGPATHTHPAHKPAPVHHAPARRPAPKRRAR